MDFTEIEQLANDYNTVNSEWWKEFNRTGGNVFEADFSILDKKLKIIKNKAQIYFDTVDWEDLNAVEKRKLENFHFSILGPTDEMEKEFLNKLANC